MDWWGAGRGLSWAGEALLDPPKDPLRQGRRGVCGSSLTLSALLNQVVGFAHGVVSLVGILRSLKRGGSEWRATLRRGWALVAQLPPGGGIQT